MAASQVRVHDCFDVLAGESKPPKCKCPTRVSSGAAQELIASGKAKYLNPWSIASLLVRNPVARAANPKVLAANETERDFIQKFRTSLPESELSDGDVLEVVKNPDRFKESEAYPIGRQLSEHYWNKVQVNCSLSVTHGEFLSGAPSGRGKLISGGYDSEKVSKIQAQREKDGKRVKAANFRKGEFNGGIISSPGYAPDKYEESLDGFRQQGYDEPAAVNSHDTASDPNQVAFSVYFKWDVRQIATIVLSLQSRGYSQEKIIAEISHTIVKPTFVRKAVTLICRGCGETTERVLNIPPDVTVQEKQYFICIECNGLLTQDGRHRLPRRKVPILKPDELAALNAQLNTPLPPIDIETKMAKPIVDSEEFVEAFAQPGL